MKLTHVCIITEDLEGLTQFYQVVLQIEPEVYRGEYVEFPSGDGGATLSLYSLESHDKLAPGTMEAALNRSVQLEFQVADVETARRNEQGDSSHERYRRRQNKKVLRRLSRGLVVPKKKREGR